MQAIFDFGATSTQILQVTEARALGFLQNVPNESPHACVRFRGYGTKARSIRFLRHRVDLERFRNQTVERYQVTVRLRE